MNTRESPIESLRISRRFHLGLVPFIDTKGFASGFCFSWRTELRLRVTKVALFLSLLVLGSKKEDFFSFFTPLSFFWWISRGVFEVVIEWCLVTRKMGLFS